MNFTKAADLLHITQPAVSQHIRTLEQQYGAKLFCYAGKQLTLTQAGHMLLQAATTMRHDLFHLQQDIHQLNARRQLHFGATLTIGEYIMPVPLARLLQQEPELQLRMIVANTAELLQLLDEGQIEFAIVEGFFAKQAYDSLIYRRERYLPVCAPDFPLPPSISSLENLLEQRLLVREPGSGTREVLERTLEEHNLTIKDFSRLTEIGSLGAIKSMVCAGAGISFFYQPVIQAELDAGHLQEIPISDCSITHSFAFLWRKGSVFAPYYRRMYALLQP